MPDAWKYDPLYIIEEYGTDALRYMLTTSSTPGNDMNLDTRRLEGARNFANKIWQATRFILMNLSDEAPLSLDQLDQSSLTLPDRWILSRINRLSGDVFRLIERYQYGEAGRQIRDFLWDEFCDWYIEATKARLYADETEGAEAKAIAQAVLLTVLEQAMRLLHPFMPFVTEVIWQALPQATKQGDALIVAPWPMGHNAWLDDEAEAQMGVVMELVRGIRNVRSEYNVAPGKRVAATVAAAGMAGALAENRDVLVSLARLDAAQVTIVEACEPLAQSASVVVGDVVTYLPLAGMVDLAAERARLEKELAGLTQRIAGSEKRLAGPFAEKAPAHVVQQHRDNLAAMKVEAEQVAEQIVRLSE